MVRKLTMAILLSLLFLSAQGQTQEKDYTYKVCGRVVDDTGKPVPRALVRVDTGPVAETGCLLFGSVTDEEGKFCYEETTAYPNRERVLYVTGPTPSNTADLLNFPFWRYNNLVGTQYSGKPILIKKNGKVNLGDVPVQARYGAIYVYLQDTDGAPLLTKAEQWKYVYLHLNDEEGREILTGQGLSLKDIEQAVNLNDSYIAVALPEGIYKLDVYLSGSIERYGKRWLRSKYPIEINPLKVPQFLELKLPTQ